MNHPKKTRQNFKKSEFLLDFLPIKTMIFSQNNFYPYIFLQMSEEIQTQKNTVATVGMRFSIIWLIALITILFSRLWLPLLFVWFVLWIIGLFYKPRGKARVAVCIPLVVFIVITSTICYIWSSVKTPAEEFTNWAKVEFENIDNETFDNERFNAITNEEFNSIFSSLSEEDWNSIIETSTWSNVLEKASYTIFGLLQKGLESSLEKYNNGYTPEIINEDNEIISVDIDTENNENNDENNDWNETKENVEVFTQSEKNDIEQILNILE